MSPRSPHAAYFFYYGVNELQAVRAGRWKLHFEHAYRTLRGREPGRDGQPGQYDHGARTDLALYDLEADIGETRDVAAEHVQVVARLRALAEVARADLGDRLTGVEPSGARAPGRSDAPPPPPPY